MYKYRTKTRSLSQRLYNLCINKQQVDTPDVGKQSDEMRAVSITGIIAQQLPAHCSVLDGYHGKRQSGEIWKRLMLIWRIIIYCVTYAGKTLLTIQSRIQRQV